MKIWTVVFTYFSLSVLFCIYCFFNLPDNPSPDARKTEWHYVTVVNKYDSTSCSKSGCNTYRTVVVEVEPEWYEYITVDESAYNSAMVGKKIGLSKHLVDPSYLRARESWRVSLLNLLVSLLAILFVVEFVPQPKRK